MCDGSHRYRVISRRRPVSSSGFARLFPRLDASLGLLGAIRGGLYDIALVVGAEKMNYPEKRKEAFAAFKGSMDLDLADAQMQALIKLGEGLDLPPEALQDSGDRSNFMDLYSVMARMHMRLYGTTQRQIAEVASRNHWHSQWSPMAQYRKPMSVEEVMSDKLVSWPMTRSMRDGAWFPGLVLDRGQ